MDPAFFASVRASLYGGALSQHQVDCLNAINAAWEQFGDGDDRKLAYILATAHHETGAFKWLKEIWGQTKAQKGYEMRADLGNTLPGDGKKFMGRGFCQITGRRNYADWSKRLGLDLIKEPQLAETLAIAARILVEGSMLGTFTGKKLGDYFNASADWAGARRVINGVDKAAMIGRYAQDFYIGLLAGQSAPAPTDVTPASPLPSRPPEPAPVSTGRRVVGWLILAAVVAAAVIFVIIKH